MESRSIATPAELRDALRRDGSLANTRRLIADLPHAVLIADRLGRYVAVNRAACALTGYREEELLRKALPDLTAQVDEHVADALWRAFVASGAQQGEFTLQRRDGAALLVRYDALSNVAPGLHAAFLEPVRDR